MLFKFTAGPHKTFVFVQRLSKGKTTKMSEMFEPSFVDKMTSHTRSR